MSISRNVAIDMNPRPPTNIRQEDYDLSGAGPVFRRVLCDKPGDGRGRGRREQSVEKGCETTADVGEGQHQQGGAECYQAGKNVRENQRRSESAGLDPSSRDGVVYRADQLFTGGTDDPVPRLGSPGLYHCWGPSLRRERGVAHLGSLRRRRSVSVLVGSLDNRRFGLRAVSICLWVQGTSESIVEAYWTGSPVGNGRMPRCRIGAPLPESSHWTGCSGGVRPEKITLSQTVANGRIRI